MRRSVFFSVEDLINMFGESQHDALMHAYNTKLVHTYRYLYKFCFLKMIGSERSVPIEDGAPPAGAVQCPVLLEDMKDAGLTYAFMRTSSMEGRCLLHESEHVALSILSEKRAKARGDDIKEGIPMDVDLRKVCIRLRNDKTMLEAVMSLENVARCIALDPPVGFYYSIGFLGAEVN